MDDYLKSIILEQTDSQEVLGIELIQNLWSDYGSLSRVILDSKSVILKLIHFPEQKDHPKGWNTNLSHQRKEKSYNIETNFYKKYNDGNRKSYFPRYIASGKTSKYSYIILEDLKSSDYIPRNTINWDEVKGCLKWLANFHIHFYNKAPKDLWEIGTYWHLDTRPDELEILEDIKLKNSASKIDQILNAAKHKTFVHGDAKLANFLFRPDDIAAVDFQYIGGGVGIKDVVYFMSSIYNEDELSQKEDDCLNIYFEELNNPAIEKEWRELYPYAWCDFYRFLKGWAPDHYKINSYSERMKDKVLKCL